MTPWISVVIPSYNRRAFLRAAVRSVLGDPRVEVVVVDDGSGDRSWETLEDLPVRFLRLARNRGIAHARNLGVQAARGEFIAFLDSDDLSVRGSLIPRAETLRANPRWRGLVGMPAGTLDANGKIRSRFRARSTPPAQLTLSWLQQGNRFSSAPGLWFFRRNVLLDAPFDPSVRIVCDTELMLRLLREGPLPVWNRPVIWVRHHGDNISRDPAQALAEAPARVLAESHLLNLQYGIPSGRNLSQQRDDSQCAS